MNQRHGTRPVPNFADPILRDHGFERAEIQIVLEKHGFADIKFVTAHTIENEEKSYPIFLVTATKR